MRTAIQFGLSSPLAAASAALVALAALAVLVASVPRVLLRVVSVLRASVPVRVSVLRLPLLR